MKDINIKKQQLLTALAKVTKELRGKKSLFMLAGENDISISIISTIERGLKDPQLTTFVELAEALNFSPALFMKKILDNLPDGFCFIEK